MFWIPEHCSGGSLPLFPARILQAAWLGMESTARTPGVTPASNSPLLCTVPCGKERLILFFIKASAVIDPSCPRHFPDCPTWGWRLGLRHTSPKKDSKIVSGALSWQTKPIWLWEPSWHPAHRALGSLLKGFGEHILVGSQAA